MTSANNKKLFSYPLVDILKTICTILIVGSHSLPLLPSKTFNLIYGQWLFRFCVPVFFISSGFFFSKMSKKKRRKYIKRVFVLYMVSTIIYIPFVINSISTVPDIEGIKQIVKYFIFGYGHLWYLCALFFSLLIWYFLSNNDSFKKIDDSIVLFTAICTLFFGAFFDEYYHMTDIHLISRIGTILDEYGSTRSAIFMGLPLLCIGRYIERHKTSNKIKIRQALIITILTSCASLAEMIFIVRHVSNNYMPTCDITFFNWIPAVMLFVVSLKVPCSIENIHMRYLRKTADIVYIIHPLVISLLNKFLMNIKYMQRFILVLIISYSASFLVISFFRLRHIQKDS